MDEENNLRPDFSVSTVSLVEREMRFVVGAKFQQRVGRINPVGKFKQTGGIAHWAPIKELVSLNEKIWASKLRQTPGVQARKKVDALLRLEEYVVALKKP